MKLVKGMKRRIQTALTSSLFGRIFQDSSVRVENERQASQESLTKTWKCVVCNTPNQNVPAPNVVEAREGTNCVGCGLGWRHRALALAVLQSQAIADTSLSNFSGDFSIVGVGTSEIPQFAFRLAEKFWFTNTHLHVAPVLDLGNPDAQWRNVANFVVCSEVLEHTPPPPERALHGLFSILKDEGTAIITVPYALNQTTQEFYPNLSRSRVIDGVHYWENEHGQEFIDEDPEFHGGSVPALTYRVWSLTDLKERLKDVGFSNVSHLRSAPERGVPAVSEVLLARK